MIALGVGTPVPHSIPQNNFASWKFANDQGNHTISQPVLSILATKVRSREHETGKLNLSWRLTVILGSGSGYGIRSQAAAFVRLLA